MMPQAPWVTIAIPTYNRARSYLPQAIQSALAQTYPYVEIVIADNGSSDNTEHVVKSFSDSRIKYFRHAENMGASSNFNFCVQQAKGSYFMRFHDDDLLDHDFVETCLVAADQQVEVGVIRTGVRLIDSSSRTLAVKSNMVKGLSMEDFILGWFAGKTWPYLCSTLFNTKRLKEMGGFKSKHYLFDDVTAAMVLAARFGRIDIEAIKASSRVHHETRTASAKVIEWCEDSLELLDLLCELSSHKSALIRRKGMKFFAWINYHRASAVSLPYERLCLYWMIFKTFQYQYSPFSFLICRHSYFRKAIRFLRRFKVRGHCLLEKSTR